MEIKYSKATEDDHAHVTRALEWAKRWDMAYSGIPIDDGDSYEEGVIIKFIVPEGFNKADVEKAAKDVVQDRDVIDVKRKCPQWALCIGAHSDPLLPVTIGKCS